MRGVRCEVSGVRRQVSGVRCEVAGVRNQASGVRFLLKALGQLLGASETALGRQHGASLGPLNGSWEGPGRLLAGSWRLPRGILDQRPS